MGIDRERLHQLHLDLRELLDALADRLPEQDTQELRSLSDVGEWALLVDGLCAALVKLQIAVTPGERDALAAQLATFTIPKRHHPYLNDPDGTLAALNVDE